MFPSMPTATSNDLVFDDDVTYAPANQHPVAKAAADARGAAARNREYRAREKDRATLDLVLVDAMVSAQMHARDHARIKLGDDSTPPPLLFAEVLRYAYRELRERGWEKVKAHDALVARLAPKRPYLPPL